MKWTKTIKLPATQPALSIKDQLKAWRLPKHLRGTLRQERRVLLNGIYQPTSTILKPGDELTMQFLTTDFEPGQTYLANTTQELPILFENTDLIVINKPKGMKSHPNSPTETETVMNYVEGYLQQTGQHAYMVHRLDGQTTGAMMVAKNPIVVPILNQLLREKRIKRTYMAWVCGAITEEHGVIDLPIGEHPTDSRLRQVNGANALPAQTTWTKVHHVYQNTLVRLDLQTGRTHQIRLHMAAIGHPLVGDDLYNPRSTYTDGLLLHAMSLQIPLPFAHEVHSIGAPLPCSFPRNLRKTIQ
ncbi:MAG: RluA family pseudouridine synthase [Lactobacillaceae bacterium]|nr:RluA family pseudouridine synthase [Lactobacillaceae bacterium]